MDSAHRQRFETEVRARFGSVAELCAELIRVPSENPPGDTRALATLIEARLATSPAIVVRRAVAKEPAVNLIAKLSGKRPGRRLIMNGHLDTFPVGNLPGWTVDPFGGIVRGGRLYGRGAADMKAGLAAAVSTALLMAEHRDAFAGELVLTLVGDEETGGEFGTRYLLANEPDAIGDAMISGDAGSPDVLRFGEKGQLWIELEARGESHHGAHVHLGDNAIETLMGALERLTGLRDLSCPIPDAIRQAILAAGPRSELVSGIGETDALQRVTVNIGTIEGGISVNLIPDRAIARADIRFPPGLAVADVSGEIRRLIGGLRNIRAAVLSSSEPNWTDPAQEIVVRTASNAADILGRAPARNMRLGFSDSRFYRYKSVPSVVYGPVPHNMGGPDEHVTLDDLRAVFYVHAMTAFDFLSHLGQTPLPRP
ncbi:MAG TPA: M20/M25/M40 family metallo-hydrolase [Stellaceae bacterium]|nr:M20/M25/M40 family metallo-hydrolase [Stellaceae bacterium]